MGIMFLGYGMLGREVGGHARRTAVFLGLEIYCAAEDWMSSRPLTRSATSYCRRLCTMLLCSCLNMECS